MQRRIADGEYAARLDKGGVRTTNRAHDLRVSFDGQGARVTSRSGSSAIELGLRLASWGRTGEPEPALEVEPWLGSCIGGAFDETGGCLRRVEYVRPGIVEWWVNSRSGLEHGFTVEQAVGSGPLVLDLEVTGMQSEVESEGSAVRLTSASGAMLRYAGLAVYDADGAALPARFEAWPGGVRIVADTSDAAWPVVVDPMLTSVAWTVMSDQLGSSYGRSVAPAGDVNGDGFGDLIVGAWAYDSGETDEGRAFVYLGSASGLATTAAWTDEGNQVDAKFGFSVASAGDVNGDGFGDVIVGTWAYDSAGQQDSGRAFVYLGSASGLGATATWTAVGDRAAAYFGWSVASAGDVNGDGFGDVIIGATMADGANAAGRAFVYHGSPAGPGTSAAWSAGGVQRWSYFGKSVAAAGDVNGDGFGDVIVGAPEYDNPQTDEGRAFVYFGSSSGLQATASWTAESDQASAYFGISVASAGDVNGDGFGDIVVGAGSYDDDWVDEGRVFVYLGSASGPGATATWMTDGGQTSANFGVSVASAGDINGDGFGDVLVGASGYSNGQTYEGRAFLYLGSSAGLGETAAWTAEGNFSAAGFGFSLASVGDMNGDGFSDIVVGASGYDRGRGRAFAYGGSGSGLGRTTAWLVESNQENASFGDSVALAGDVNGDGFDDVIVGARNHHGALSWEGRAFVYLGSASGLETSANWTVAGDQYQAFFGDSVASAGDVNGDGFDDVIISASGYTIGGIRVGRVFLYLGSASGVELTPVWVVEGDQAYACFGCSVASAGDVNRDGFDDVIVGARNYRNSAGDDGRVYVYLGSDSGLAATPVWVVDGDAYPASFGHSVASAGDVNGDGFGDVIVGAYGNGRVFVYLGSISGITHVPAWTTEIAGMYFGYSVASAGDINGDGFGDVVIGATRYENDQNMEGAAFVYLGSATGLQSTWAWMAEGNYPESDFGAVVASAGDVNGDGFGDVVIGAPDGGELQLANGGFVSVYLGSASGLPSAASWVVPASALETYFGASVAGAGDVNGDGFGDLVVGAPSYRNGQRYEGGAFLYLGNGGDGTGAALAMRPQARQPGSTTPIAPHGRSSARDSFDVAVFGRPPYGRGRMKLQVEVKPQNDPFDGAGLHTTGGWIDSGVTGAQIQRSITGLVADTGYHWRARLLYDPAQGFAQLWSHWLWGGISGQARGVHVRTTCAVPVLWYSDADGDGFGNAAVTTSSCSRPPGYASNTDDCDDADPASHPGAADVCDGNDNDCSGGLPANEMDHDGDGYVACSPWLDTQHDQPQLGGGDNDDSDPNTGPGGVELCDGRDNNGDGRIDEGTGCEVCP